MKYVKHVLILLLFITGCNDSGVIVTSCTPRVKEKDLSCYNEAAKMASIVPPSSADNWIFVSAADNRSIQVACMNSNAWPKVTVCSLSAKIMQLVCYNEITQKTSVINFEDADGMIGYSPVDEQIILEFCASRAKG